MANRHFLHRKHDRGPNRKVTSKPTMVKLLDLVQDQIIGRLAHMSATDIQAVALAVSEPNEEDPAPNPSHPACLEFASTDYCHESWQLHLAKLKRRPETHWGTCQHLRTCAMIPIVCQNRCLAVVKLAGPASLDKAEFKRVVDIMELLVRGFAAAQADFLKHVPGGITAEEATTACAESMAGPKIAPSPTHPQVLRALEYVVANLSDPRLTVAGAAAALGLCPTYLSEIFVEQTAQRMSRFIAARRIEHAKKLLATTNWQIKRVAIETGHANANWFCHVFSVHTGLTPGEYRTALHSQDSAASDR